MFGRSKFRAIAVVSDAMRNPMRGSLAYCASKAALAAIIKNLAREWAPDTFVAGVAPAVVADTPMSDYIDSTVPDFRGWTPEQAKAYEQTMLPLKRRVTKNEVAEVMANLLFGPEYLTGTIIDITGGK
jgi:NAD(P)-dependent dehydrogenase (short-subunit alcohol dehydrogenase family)